MIEQYDLSFLNLHSICNVLYSSKTSDHGLLTKGTSSFNFGMPTLMYEELQSLNKIIKKYVKLYCDKYDISKLKFINSWFNITEPGSRLKAHNHGENGESILSGAFYVSVGKNSVPLILPNTSIKPYPGLLIIFPSSFTHYTEEEREQRIVISFNMDYEESTRYTGH
jgi:hypothetical protein